MTVELLAGDCLEVLPTLAESSVDSCVTDPPYHLTSIVKRFANAKAESEVYAATSNSGYMSRGFMGKQWDGGDIAFRLDVWREVYRVLKPGAHLLAFGGTRTYHRMACAIEDAGFEIRDCIMWVYGSGFPKSHDVSKGIDRAAGVERVVIGSKLDKPGYHLHSHDGGEAFGHGLSSSTYETRLKSSQITEAATDAACRWQGWGTALKPAVEPIVLARKPLSEDTVAANVLRWGTGAVNVDGCRVGEREEIRITWAKRTSNCYGVIDVPGGKELPPGRWPSNLIHDGSEEVVAGFPEADGAVSNGRKGVCGVAWGKGLGSVGQEPGYNDSGSAARFFYTAKADSDDRLGSKHPTVKPLDLLQYLVRLVTPKGGLVLDPFAGTGTTGEAAFREGMNAVLIEREAEYQADIRRRMAMFLAGPDERAREAVKERMKDKPRDDGPLFA